MLKPLNNNILIEPLPVEHKTASGLEIIEHAQQSRLIRQVYPDKAKVIYNDIIPEVKEGDIIIYNRIGSQDITGTPYEVLDARSVYGVAA